MALLFGESLPAELRVIRGLIDFGDTVDPQTLERGHEIIPAGIQILPPEDEFRRHLRNEVVDTQSQLGHFGGLRGGESQRRDQIFDSTSVGLVSDFGLLKEHDFQACGIVAPDLAQTQVIGTIARSALRPVYILQRTEGGKAAPDRFKLATAQRWFALFRPAPLPVFTRGFCFPLRNAKDRTQGRFAVVQAIAPLEGRFRMLRLGS